MSLLGLEVLETLLLEQTLSKVSLTSSFFLLALTVVPDVHEVLGTLSLGINLFQDSLLIALEDTEARLKRLEHASVLIFDAFSKDQ